MSGKKILNSETKEAEKSKEQILYGINKTVCFACGEEIDKNTHICPYCKTLIK